MSKPCVIFIPITVIELSFGFALQYPHQDSERVLECLQKSLRIANSAIEEIVTVQLYCDTLDHYLYYFDRGAPAVSVLSTFLFLSMILRFSGTGCTQVC